MNQERGKMLDQKLLYEGDSSGIFRYDAFQLFMKDKGLRIPYRDLPVYKKDIYIIEPATTLIYKARKRIIPRGLDLWHVMVTLSGYVVEEVGENLTTLISKQKS